MLKKLMNAITNLIEEQVHIRTCLPLRPDLHTYLSKLIGINSLITKNTTMPSIGNRTKDDDDTDGPIENDDDIITPQKKRYSAFNRNVCNQLILIERILFPKILYIFFLFL